ncbi:GntR family transcriptional regulator [Arthrobacter sp. ERGS1:01]|uniref:FadR/GntR family transcriptional regulator n=1 Tax=Arthrobacter sp. ERGS1:01 TaxID=1704044 RepID=UPI0006B5B728|nr:FCD domain-containing protein [Arthrobacter sp. ERGS1:01]ALE07813.1 GntR family transcriptional regulator [Arthrobacter sp. ERGS1:01]
MDMSSVHRESLSDQVARLLLERIQAGEWEVGQKLPGETTLGPQLGVGRSTVREAIRQLCGQGVLLTRQGAGVFLHAVNPAEDWDALVTRTNITSILEARIAIECEAAALAAERHTHEDMLAIRAALKLRDADRITIEVRVDSDTALHRSIVVASHNEVLTELFDTFAARSRDAMILMLKLNNEPGTEHDQFTHQAIVEAIATRDAGAASELSRTHLVALRDGVTHHQNGTPS